MRSLMRVSVVMGSPRYAVMSRDDKQRPVDRHSSAEELLTGTRTPESSERVGAGLHLIALTYVVNARRGGRIPKGTPQPRTGRPGSGSPHLWDMNRSGAVHVPQVPKTPRRACPARDSAGMRMREVLERQAGVVSLAQAQACGVSPDVPQRRASAGDWTRLHPGVYLVGGHTLSDDARLWAAWLWAEPGAVVSGRAAAYWHGMLRRPGRVELTLPRERKPRRMVGLEVRRRALDPADVVRIRGLPVTAPPLTALTTTLTEGSAFLDRALQRHVRLQDLEAAFLRGKGSHGWPALAPILAAAGGAESEAERLMVKVLRDAGIDGWVHAHPAGHWLIDLAFLRERLAIEVDAGRGIRTSSVSGPTGASTTSSRSGAGRCCVSPGTTSTAPRARRRAESTEHFVARHEDLWDTSRSTAVHVPQLSQPAVRGRRRGARTRSSSGAGCSRPGPGAGS
jgi:hypothetical protein